MCAQAANDETTTDFAHLRRTDEHERPFLFSSLRIRPVNRLAVLGFNSAKGFVSFSRVSQTPWRCTHSGYPVRERPVLSKRSTIGP